jgi:hypothetical protein
LVESVVAVVLYEIVVCLTIQDIFQTPIEGFVLFETEWIKQQAKCTGGELM